MLDMINTWNLDQIADHRPSDYVYALMSDRVYSDVKNEIFDGQYWKVIKIHGSKSSGYFGAIYINPDTKHIVVAHRGTNNIVTVIEDIRGVVLNGSSPQKQEAFRLVSEAIKLAKKKNLSLSFTGHSLGAFLAELSVFYCKREGFHKVNAVTFESPGSKESLEKLQSNLEDHVIDLNNLDIISYLSYPNLINTYNHHVGTIYTIAPDLGKWGWVAGKYTQQAHSMSSGILDCFSNQKIFDKRKFLKDWPKNSLSDRQMKHFFKVAKFDNGYYSLPADEELNNGKYFTLLYKAHYDLDPHLSAHNILPIKHFGEDMQKFLIIFKAWQEENKNVAEEKLKNISIPANIISHLLSYNLITINKNTFLVSGNIEAAFFRKELSIALQEQGIHIKALIKSLAPKKLEIIASILAPRAQLLEGGAINHVKLTGLNITIPEGTSKESVDIINQVLENTKKDIGQISAFILAPGATSAGVINNATISGVSMSLIQAATYQEPVIIPSYNKQKVKVFDITSLHNNIHQTDDSEEPALSLDSNPSLMNNILSKESRSSSNHLSTAVSPQAIHASAISGTGHTVNANNVETIGQQNLYFIQQSRGEYLKPIRRWKLPNSIPSFIGREKELNLLKNGLHTDIKGIIGKIIVGLGGIGKTVLAVEYAKRSINYDFIAFINANSQTSLFTEFRGLAIAFGMMPETIEKIAAQDLICFVYQKLYEQYNKVLVIFDDATSLKTIKGLDNYEKTLANYELPEQYSNKIHWLITTKNQHFSNQMKAIRINVFSIEEARKYIKERLINKENDHLMDQLAKKLGYFPLALTYATAYININNNRLSIEEYLKLYNTSEEEKELLNTDINSEAYGKTLYNTWKISMNELNQISLKILNYCAFLNPTLIPLSLVRSIINQEITESLFNNALYELEKYSLVDYISMNQGGKNINGIILHSVLQKVIRLHLSNTIAEEYYDRLVHIVNKEFQRETDNYSEDEDRQRDLFTHLTFLIDYVDKNFSLDKLPIERKNVIANLLIGISSGYELLGKDAKKSILYCRRAVKIKEEIYGKDSLETVPALKRLGICDKDNAEEHFRRAIKIMTRTLPHNIEIFRIKSCLANVLTVKGGKKQLKEAKQIYEEAIKIQRESCKKDPQNLFVLSSSILNFAILQEKLGNLDKSIELMEEAYNIRKKSYPKHLRVIATLKPLARLYSKKGQYDKAIEVLKEAITISKSYYGDDNEKTIDLQNLIDQLSVSTHQKS